MKWFKGSIWPDGRICPHYKYGRTYVAAHPNMPYYCSKYKHSFSVKTWTVMERSKGSYRKLVITTHLVAMHSKGMSHVQLSCKLGIGQNTHGTYCTGSVIRGAP